MHFISVAHCCSLLLIEDITQTCQDVYHIWKILHYKVLQDSFTFLSPTAYGDCIPRKQHIAMITGL